MRTAKVNFGKVQLGTYQMVESKVPEGYAENTAKYRVTVGERETVIKDDVQDVVMKEIINIPNTVPLPESGGAGTTIYTFGGIALLAVCLVYGCSLRRRRERRAK